MSPRATLSFRSIFVRPYPLVSARAMLPVFLAALQRFFMHSLVHAWSSFVVSERMNSADAEVEVLASQSPSSDLSRLFPLSPVLVSPQSDLCPFSPFAAAFGFQERIEKGREGKAIVSLWLFHALLSFIWPHRWLSAYSTTNIHWMALLRGRSKESDCLNNTISFTRVPFSSFFY